ncbi:MAG: GGDEF domain-containing protein [Mycobacteriaceae bacterium]|nr:GGDEF domain-containing protein [Mycobacteriaceae bacterium]
MASLIRGAVQSLRPWWRRGDHFDWLSAYLATRDLQGLVRWTVVATTVFLSAITISMQWSQGGSWRPVGQAAALSAAAVSLTTALLWARRWPTRRQSACYVAISDAGIAIACLSYRNPLLGLAGCASFAVLGGYAAFFHTPRVLAAHLGSALVTAVTLTVVLGLGSDDWVAASCMFSVIMVAVLAVPMATQVLVHRLAVDVAFSDVDPLCGLLNRRAFYQRSRELCAAATARAEQYLAVTMLDLDRFKQLNDAHGHAVGDRALIAVGEILRRHHNDAVVARVGGEEFLVAELADRADGAASAEQVRRAIADSPFGITASIGVVSTRVPHRSTAPASDVIDELIRGADAAMYDAKRHGGNQIRHRLAGMDS